jgi:hypothetical protein
MSQDHDKKAQSGSRIVCADWVRDRAQARGRDTVMTLHGLRCVKRRTVDTARAGRNIGIMD